MPKASLIINNLSEAGFDFFVFQSLIVLIVIPVSQYQIIKKPYYKQLVFEITAINKTFHLLLTLVTVFTEVLPLFHSPEQLLL